MLAQRFRASLAWLMLLLSGCASASNSAWLREPEEGLLLGEPVPALATAAPPSRPRLRHTVTLGETISTTPEPNAAATDPGTNAARVNVTVNNYVTAPAPVYGGWVEPVPARVSRPHSGTPRGISPTSTRAGASQPPGNWPSPPSYGPSFPFKTGPASPWR